MGTVKESDEQKPFPTLHRRDEREKTERALSHFPVDEKEHIVPSSTLTDRLRGAGSGLVVVRRKASIASPVPSRAASPLRQQYHTEQLSISRPSLASLSPLIPPERIPSTAPPPVSGKPAPFLHSHHTHEAWVQTVPVAPAFLHPNPPSILRFQFHPSFALYAEGNVGGASGGRGVE